jgi:2',3'-cyclic-nucleotide 2'-phosphodiesterase (5'-nucleotidase family)
MKTLWAEGRRQKAEGTKQRAIGLGFLCVFCLLPSAFCLLPSGAAAEEIRASQARQGETGFGNAVADGMRAATRADVAWIAGGEFRDTTLRPATTPAEAVALLDDPADPLVVVGLTGRTIREALELGLQQYPKPARAFLHVSGLRVTFGARPEGGRRVRSITTAQGQPLADAKSYRVAMTRTLAVGSFGFFRLWPEARTLPPERATVGEALQGALAAAPLKMVGDGRMQEK